MVDAQFWDNLAEEYAAKPVELPEAFERKIEITIAAMKQSDRVLDVGCGTGSLALRLAPHGAEIHAMDVSGEMISIGRRKADAAGIGNVHFHRGAFDDSVPFEAGSLDGVLAYSILHLLDDPAAGVKRCYDLLKPGGFFISSTVVLGQSMMPYGVLLTVLRWVGKAPMVQVMRLDELRSAMEAAGFVDVEAPEVGAKFTTAFLTARKPA